MLMQSKPLAHRIPAKTQKQVKWKADNLPHTIGPVRYKLKPGFGELDPHRPVTVDELRRPRPYVHHRFDYLPLFAPEQVQQSALSALDSAEKCLEIAGGAAGITRSRSLLDEDEQRFVNGITGSLADETALQTMKEENNQRIANDARSRVRSAGKQQTNKTAKMFTYSSNAEYLQSRAKTYDQQKFHYDLSRDDVLYPANGTTNGEYFYRPQGAQYYRLRNEVLRDARGPGFITMIASVNNSVSFSFAPSSTTYTVQIPAGKYDLRTLTAALQRLIANVATTNHITPAPTLGLQFDPTADRVLATTTLKRASLQKADQFVITPATQNFWVLLGFSPLDSVAGETQRTLPSQNVLAAFSANTQQVPDGATISTAATLAPALPGGVQPYGPIVFHRNMNRAFATTAPLDASTNTFRKRYNNIQCAAPSYVPTYGLATATSLVYRKSFGPVTTLKDKLYIDPKCNLTCLEREIQQEKQKKA